MRPPYVDLRDKCPVVSVKHGRAWSPCFPLIFPVPGPELNVGQEIHCVNSKTQKVTKGIVSEFFWTYPWNEMIRGHICQYYGMEPSLLKTVLVSSDIALKTDWARIVLIWEIREDPD